MLLFSQASSTNGLQASETFQALLGQEKRNERPTVPPHRVGKRKTAASDATDLTQVLVTATKEMAKGGRCVREHLDTDDCDTLFLLSLRDRFKSLDKKKKRLAQLQIQKVLFDLEYGE